MDEAYVDVTQRCPGTRARKIARAHCGGRSTEDLREKTGCAASVGSGPNRLIARLATKRAKPDGAHPRLPQPPQPAFIAVAARRGASPGWAAGPWIS